jgi:MFS family permease
MWGTIAPYIGSYYHHLDNSVYVSDFVIVSLISYISETSFTMLACYLIRCMTPFWILTIGVAITTIGIFGSSYILNPYLFICVFSLCIGALSSSIYLPSLWILWNEYPQHKARTSGIILAGYSFGPVPFSILFTMIVNPYDYPAETVKKDGQEDEQAFGEFVSYRVPMTIRWMAFVIAIGCLVGIICLPRKWKTDSTPGSNRKPTLTICDMLKSVKAWNLFFMLLLGISSSSYIISVYKIIGIQYINDDHYVSFTGSLSFFISCFGRILYGILFDRYYWKRVMVVTYLLIMFLFLTFGFCLDNKFLYSFWVIAIGFLGASIYNSVLIQSDKDFPLDKWILSYICLSFIIDFALPYIFEKWITPEIGYFASFCIIAALSGVAVLQVIFHPDKAGLVVDKKDVEDQFIS